MPKVLGNKAMVQKKYQRESGSYLTMTGGGNLLGDFSYRGKGLNLVCKFGK